MRIVVHEWERVLRYVDGRCAEQLGAGVHRRRQVLTGRRVELVRVDLRPQLVAVPGQEVLTADSTTVKVSLVVSLRVADARLGHEAAQDATAVAYAALQVALRAELATWTLEQLLVSRDELGERISERVGPELTAVGRAVERVAVRDVMVPAELRRAAAELLVARHEGMASLERARAETAALRALANAAKIAADHPALLQLRTLQAVESGRATVVLRHDV